MAGKRATLSAIVAALLIVSTPQKSEAIGLGAIAAAIANAATGINGTIISQVASITADLTVGNTISGMAEFSAQKSQLKQAIVDRLGGGPAAQKFGDIIDGCLQGFMAKAGFDFDLPDITICGHNIMDDIVEALLDNLNVHYSSKILVGNDKGSPVKVESDSLPPNVVENLKNNIKEFFEVPEKEVGSYDTSNGSGSITDSPKDGDEKSSAREEIENGASYGMDTIVPELESGSGDFGVFAGTSSSGLKESFLRRLVYKSKKRKEILEADRRKDRQEYLALNNFASEDGPPAAENLSKRMRIVFPLLRKYDATVGGDKDASLSSRDDGKVYTLDPVIITVYDYYQNRSELVASLKKTFKECTDEELELDPDNVMDYSRLYDLIAKVTMAAVSTIKPDTEDGRVMIHSELMKGNLYINALRGMAEDSYQKYESSVEYRRYSRMIERLGAIATGVDVGVQQRAVYGKESLSRGAR